MNLPSHPCVRSTDPLGICSSDDYDIPLWDVLRALLQQNRPQNSHDLLDLLTDIAASTGRADSVGDYQILSQLLRHPPTADSFFSGGLPALLDIALQLPTLFPTHTLQTLHPGTHATSALTRRQAYCLIAHMFLGTLQAPPWQHWWVDFGVWQHSSSSSSSKASGINQAGITTDNIWRSKEPSAAPAEDSMPVLSSPASVYLHILLTYFDQMAGQQYAKKETFWKEMLVITRVHILPTAAAAASVGTSGSGNSSRSCGSTDACRETRSTAPSLAAAAADCPAAVHWAGSSMPLLPLLCCETELCNVQGNHLLQQQLVGCAGSAQVVFCNKEVGFGSSGTQEEQVFGSSPELCILMLCCPSLQDNEALVVQGPVLHGLISGFGQNTIYRGLAADHPGFKDVYSWQDRVLVFMDALELDEWRSDGIEGDRMAAAAAAAAASDVQVHLPFIPDLLPKHVSRELNKAFCAFSAAATACRNRGSSRLSHGASCYEASSARSEALVAPATAAAALAPAAAAAAGLPPAAVALAPAAAAALAPAAAAALDRQDQQDSGNHVAGNPVVVATGHWGCGAFRGNREVKALLQLMAASQAGCRLLFSDVGPSSSSSVIMSHGQQEEKSPTLHLQAQGTSSSSSKSFGRQLADLVDQLHSVGVTVSRLHGVLLQLSVVMDRVTAAQGQSSSSGGSQNAGRLVLFDAVAAILL